MGDAVRITVLTSASGQVRLGIEAPSELSVHREEVYQRIARANREAAEAFASWLLGAAEPTVGDTVGEREGEEQE